MIKIDFYSNGFTAMGHANSARYGNDLICAGVSAIIMGSLNWFNNNTSIEVNDNYIKVMNKNNDISNLLNLIEIQLNSMNNNENKNYLLITKHNEILF